MRRHPILSAIAAGLCFTVAAFAVEKSPPPTSGMIACDVELNVTDPDPHGLNVRSAPTTAGSVLTVLKPDGDWTSVHVIGQQGDWLMVDKAETIDDKATGGSRKAFAGKGWVHVSKVGVSELFTGTGTVLRDRPAANGKALLRIKEEDASPTLLLGCKGKYIQVRHLEHTGWTNTWCNNERTTCN